MTAQWTAPQTWNTNDLVTASDLNEQLRDNLEWLKTPPSANYVLNQGSDYTTTSTTFANVDGTNLSLTITPVGSIVLIGFVGSFANSSAGVNIYLDVDINGTRLAGDDGLMFATSPAANSSFVLPFVALKTGLTPNTPYTFKLQWKVGAGTGKLFAGAGTGGADVHPQFWVREI